MVYVVGISLLAKLVTRRLKRANEMMEVAPVPKSVVKIHPTGENVIAKVSW